MKKWHMESIIEVGNDKIAVPNSPQIRCWNTISSHSSGKENLIKQVCRWIFAFFVKFL